jgi:hypothetical protein
VVPGEAVVVAGDFVAKLALERQEVCSSKVTMREGEKGSTEKTFGLAKKNL